MPVTKPPFWRDVRVLAWLFQLTILGLALAIVGWLLNNVRVNSAEQGIPTDLGFLDQPAGFPIPANDFDPSQPAREALIEGALNTLRVVVLGLVLATVLGVAIGIGRLSKNWLVRNITQVYVEVIRNVPLLGIVIFVYLAIVLSALPRIEDSWTINDALIINGRGASVPWFSGSAWLLIASSLVAAAATFAVRRWRLRELDRTGAKANVGLWALPTFVILLLVGALISGISFSTPTLDGRQVDGGITMQPEYLALLLALVLYTASHIAEIVRGSIQAVPKGQVEAATAMGLGSWDRMRQVVLPQALTIAIPPLGNQYLNLMKNSSLGLVISYFELTKVTSTAVGTRSPAVPAFAVLLVVYLIASLLISAAVNVFNKRMAI